MKFFCWAILVLAPGLALAAPGGERPRERRPAPPPPAPVVREDPGGPRPVEPAKWPGRLLLGIGAVFVAAAVIGPLYRAAHPEDEFLQHAHDEPPGASHLYGDSGTWERDAPERKL